MDIKSTELNLIPIFVAIFEEQSLSKAAARMEISQPAVSKALKRLRELYDEPLFHRKVVGMEPTSFAIDIYPAMAAALRNYRSTLSASHRFHPASSQRIFSIACVSLASYKLIPPLLRRLRQEAPGISLEIHPLFTEDMEADLRMQRYDLIIDQTPKGRSVLKSEVLYTDEAVVVCRQQHPRLTDTITLEHFLREEHVVLARWQIRDSLLNAEHIAELDQRNVVVRVPGLMEMLSIIASTEIIGILPSATVNDFSDKSPIKSLPFPFHEPPLSLSAIWHPSRTHEEGLKWLRKQLQAVVKSIGL